jgi:hypothetical protein
MFASYDPDDPLLQLIETGLVYFSYPGTFEKDSQRAVSALAIAVSGAEPEADVNCVRRGDRGAR